MDLKKYLRGKLAVQQSGLERELKATKGAVVSLDRTDLERAVYEVNLHSLWADYGGKDVVVTHSGNISDAVALAEQKFKMINRKRDVQAIYRVSIVLNGQKHLIPAECYYKSD